LKFTTKTAEAATTSTLRRTWHFAALATIPYTATQMPPERKDCLLRDESIRPTQRATIKKPVPQRLCRDFEAHAYVKKPVFDAWSLQAGLKPVVNRHKLTLFDYTDLDNCIDRMKEEGLPE
jgi:hypothetical protein